MDDDEHGLAPQFIHTFASDGATSDAIAQSRLLDPLTTAAATTALLGSSSCDTPDLSKSPPHARQHSNSPLQSQHSSPQSQSPVSPRAAAERRARGKARSPVAHSKSGGKAKATDATVVPVEQRSVENSALNVSHFTISLSAPIEDQLDGRGGGESPSSSSFRQHASPTNAGSSDTGAQVLQRLGDDAVAGQGNNVSPQRGNAAQPILLVEIVTSEILAIDMNQSASIIDGSNSTSSKNIAAGGVVTSATPNVPIATHQSTVTTGPSLSSGNDHLAMPPVDVVVHSPPTHDGDVFMANLTSSSASSGVVRIPPEQLRLLLLDQADREALVYADDHNARRRLAVLHRAILDHNDVIRRNVRSFFLSTGGDASSTTLPNTQAFTEVTVPSRFIDPVTKRLISEPVVFAGKRVMDRPSAEALTFRLFSTMLRCHTLGVNKRQEYFMYCLDNVLVSSITKQWRRQAFGFRGLELTPRPDIATSIREWIALQMSLCVDLRESIEREIQTELNIDTAAGTTSSGKRSPTQSQEGGATHAVVGGYNIGATMVFLQPEQQQQQQQVQPRRNNSTFAGSVGGQMLNASLGGGMLLDASHNSVSNGQSGLMEDSATQDLREVLRNAIEERKVPKEWDTLEHMWCNVCAAAIRWKKRKKKRSGSAAVAIRRSLQVLRKMSASVSPSPSRRGTRLSSSASPQESSSPKPRSRQTSQGGGGRVSPTSPGSGNIVAYTVPTGSNAAAGGGDVDNGMFLSIGVEIAGSTSFDVAEHLSTVAAEESSGREAVMVEEAIEAGDLSAVQDQLKAAVVFELQRSTNSLAVPAGGPRRRVSVASSTGGRPVSTALTSPMSSPLHPPGAAASVGFGLAPRHPSAVGAPQQHQLQKLHSVAGHDTSSVGHRAVRHKVSVHAGANHRVPHQPVLTDVMGAMVVKRPATVGFSSGNVPANVPEEIIGCGGSDAIALALAGGPLGAPSVAEPTSQPQSAQQSPLKGAGSASTTFKPAATEHEAFDLLSALDSLTGLVESLLAPSAVRAQRAAAPPPKRGDPPSGMITEDITLVSATMRLHQDRELMNNVFEFSEKWFLDMEEKCMKWATDQFTAMAEQQAKERSIGSRQRQLLASRKELRPSSCVVSGSAAPDTPRPTAAASPRSETSRRHNKTPTLSNPKRHYVKPKVVVSENPAAVAEVQLLQADDAAVGGEKLEGNNVTVPLDCSVEFQPSAPAHAIVPSSAWRERLQDKKKKSTDASLSGQPLGQPIPPCLQVLIPARAPGITSTTTCGGGGIVLKPPWAAELERQRNKPSLSSDYLRTSYDEAARNMMQSMLGLGGAAGGNERGGGEQGQQHVELPTHELMKELELLYMQFDINSMHQEVLRKRELGRYYFEPQLFEDEVLQKEAARHSHVFSKLSSVSVADLDHHWNQPTVATLFGYDAGGDGGGQRRAAALLQQHQHQQQQQQRDGSSDAAPRSLPPPRLALPVFHGGGSFDGTADTERVPIRPHSSTVGARSWAATTNYAVQACGQDSRLGASALLAATIRKTGSAASLSSGRNSVAGLQRQTSANAASLPLTSPRVQSCRNEVRPPTGRPPTTGRRLEMPSTPVAASASSARLPKISPSGSASNKK